MTWDFYEWQSHQEPAYVYCASVTIGVLFSRRELGCCALWVREHVPWTLGGWWKRMDWCCPVSPEDHEGAGKRENGWASVIEYKRWRRLREGEGQPSDLFVAELGLPVGSEHISVMLQGQAPGMQPWVGSQQGQLGKRENGKSWGVQVWGKRRRGQKSQTVPGKFLISHEQGLERKRLGQEAGMEVVTATMSNAGSSGWTPAGSCRDRSPVATPAEVDCALSPGPPERPFTPSPASCDWWVVLNTSHPENFVVL